MKIKQIVISLFVAVSAFSSVLYSPIVSANECGGVETSIVSCTTSGDPEAVSGTAIWSLLIIIINILTVGVGVAAVGGLIYASVLYASASSNAEQIKRAKEIMLNVAIGLIMYVIMYAFLNFIVPGGMFKK